MPPGNKPSPARRAKPNSLAWISTAPNSPHKKLARMLIFRVFSPQSCYANRCADSLIFRRLLAHRLLDSGHFGALRGEKTLRTGAYQNTNLPNGRGTFPESCESLGAWDVRLNLCHVAVGTRVTPRPPHRSGRAPLCIRLLPRVFDGEDYRMRPSACDTLSRC